MERPSTPKKLTRPKLPRSHSATAATSSPPQRNQTALRQALPSLHLHTRNHHHHDRNKRHGDKISVAHTAVHAPSAVPAVLADKLASSRTSSKTDREAQQLLPEKSKIANTALEPIRSLERSVQPVEVAKERHRRVRREEELRSTLNSLTDLASTSTRRVDMLLLSIMEKVATLRSTIQKLQQLSTESTTKHREFQTEADQIAMHFARQVDTFKGFELRQQQVEFLRGRIQDSIEKSDKLQGRLKAARDRVALWEKREDEWQARTTMKLRIGWTCGGVSIALIMVILVLKAMYLRTGGSTTVKEHNVHALDRDTLWKELHIARPQGNLEWLPENDTYELMREDSGLGALDDL